MSAHELITDHLDLWTQAVTQKSTAGRGSNGKVELTGIKKLRELILELAVRGKLVEQDSDDEPAHQLLSKIESEKSRLVAEKAIKKPKKLEADSSTEPYSLPACWCWVRLGDVTNYGTTDKAEPKQIANDTWVLELEDIEKESSKLLSKIRYTERQFKSSKNQFKQGDVLYGKLRPYLDKVLVADESGVCTTEIIPIRGYLGLLPEFLRLALKSPRFKHYANESTHGMNLPRLGTDKARSAMIPLAPEKEQHRIVQKVDELMALCDRLEQHTSDQLDAHATLVDTLLVTLTQSANATELADNWARLVEHFDTLFTTEQNIEKLKQTILQLAVMGRLVEQDAGDEPTKSLLDKIDQEITSLVKQGRIKKPKPVLQAADSDKFFEIPDAWQWVRLGSLALHSEAGWSPKCHDSPRENQSWAVLKVSAVTWGEFRPGENKELPANLTPRSEYEVHPSDFLISRANTSELVARSVVVPESAPTKLMMSDKIIRFVFSKQVEPMYLNLFNNSPFARDYYLSVAGGTSSSMKNVSRAQIQTLLVPLPPLAEQHRIVQKVDELMALCDRLKQRLTQASNTRCQLAGAVVEDALN